MPFNRNYLNRFSKIDSIPLLNWISPSAAKPATDSEKEGFLRAQRLAMEAAKTVSTFIEEGWSEKQAATLLGTYLKDHGVRAYFHHPYAWFGERTRFDGIQNYAQYKPSDRLLLPNEVYILDVAPIVDGFVADIGYTDCLGSFPEFEEGMKLLEDLYVRIPEMFTESKKTGAQLCTEIETQIEAAGFENIHRKYPFWVLGHRVHRTVQVPSMSVLNFGWQSFWTLFSRGLFGQLLNTHFEGDLIGLWAVEPHIGGKTFGAKFEEILVIESNKAYWLDNKRKGGKA